MAAILALLLILSTASAPLSADVKQVSLNKEGQIEWQRVTPQGEEFSVLVPVLPAFIEQGSNGTVRENGEKILRRLSYSAYADGFIFAIESYKAERPQKLLKDLEDSYGHRMAFQREVTVGGQSGKQYHFEMQNSYGEKLSFVTKQHVYVITLAVQDENDSAIAKFLSSLIFGDKISKSSTDHLSDIKESEMYKSALITKSGPGPSQSQAFMPKEVSRKARIVWRPEPQYTEEGRKKQETGTVVLRAIFGADGQVNNIRVVSGLGSGLTEKAIEAALSIRFFPAEKDDQRVSQYIQIEYNFSLY